MIIEALEIMVFGMLGIFLVMGIVIGATVLLRRLFDKKDKA